MYLTMPWGESTFSAVSSQAFSDRLNALMFERRMSVVALADVTNIHPRLISKYRAGASVPRDKFGDPTPNARALADALGVSVADLLDAAPEALAS